MWPLLAWFALLAAAGLCYPRRPRTAGALFIALGLLTTTVVLVLNRGSLLTSVVPGVFWIGLGASYLVKYRAAAARKQHIDYWTAKA
ncbi:MAG: hypothetical protein ABI868_06865 [Acidobacteriota bacterium]